MKSFSIFWNRNLKKFGFKMNSLAEVTTLLVATSLLGVVPSVDANSSLVNFLCSFFGFVLLATIILGSTTWGTSICSTILYWFLFLLLFIFKSFSVNDPEISPILVIGIFVGFVASVITIIRIFYSIQREIDKQGTGNNLEI